MDAATLGRAIIDTKRNSAYNGSPLYRQHQDLEFFSGLVYLQVLLESGLEPHRYTSQAGVGTVAAVMRDSQTLQTLLALQESAYLRSRFRYLLASLAAREPLDDVLNRAGIRLLLDFIGGTDEHLLGRLRLALDGARELRRAVISSARIGGDLYRAPDITSEWLEGEAARSAMEEVLTSGQAGTTLGDNEDVIVASPCIRIMPGSAPSNAPRATKERARAAQEFMYVNLNILNWKHNGRLRYADTNHLYLEEDIAILMAVRPSTKSSWSMHALPGGRRRWESWILRVSPRLWPRILGMPIGLAIFTTSRFPAGISTGSVAHSTTACMIHGR